MKTCGNQSHIYEQSPGLFLEYCTYLVAFLTSKDSFSSPRWEFHWKLAKMLKSCGNRSQIYKQSPDLFFEMNWIRVMICRTEGTFQIARGGHPGGWDDSNVWLVVHVHVPKVPFRLRSTEVRSKRQGRGITTKGWERGKRRGSKRLGKRTEKEVRKREGKEREAERKGGE